MKKLVDFFRRGSAIPITLVGTAIIALGAILGITLVTDETLPEALIRIEPRERSLLVGDPLEIRIIVDSSVPVNVFAGELYFTHDVLRVSSIDYNTSIADLWAELPWYSNGDGVVHFGGGTTQQGGFVGSGTLINITFDTVAIGEGVVSLSGPKIFLDARLITKTFAW